MLCPSCKNAALVTEPLEDDLLTLRCPNCGGHWIKSFQYWRWLEQQASDVKSILTECGNANEPTDDSKPGKLCPECGRFLAHKPVGHGLSFNLDRCGHCGGMWFDKQEWNALRQRSLHTDAHMIFSDTWQIQVREDRRLDMERERLKQKLGAVDYNELLRVGQWLQHHPERAILLAVLNHEDITKLSEST